MNLNIGIVLSTNDPETVFNVFRFANFALTKKDLVTVFLLGKGVEAEQTSTNQFDVQNQMENFVAAKGIILSCGTCLTLRNKEASDLCPVSTLSDMYDLINRSDKVLTF